MQESDLDRDYISPDLPLPASGISPLARLQETCRNIGIDTPCRLREEKTRHSPLSKPQQASTATVPKAVKEKASKAPTHRERLDSTCQPPGPTFKLPTHIPISPPIAATSHTQPPCSMPCGIPYQTEDFLSASKQQIMYQRLLYQTELEKLQMPLVNNISPLIPSNSGYLSETSGLSPPTTNRSVGPTDFAKLAAYFYHKLQQTSSPITNSPLGTTTEALLNYRKMFIENNCSSLLFSTPSPDFNKPLPSLAPQAPNLQLHECHWVTSEGYCGKKHFSYDDLMLHLRSHVSSSADSLSMLNPGELPTAHHLYSEANSHKLFKHSSKDNSRHSNPYYHPARYNPYSLPLASKQLSMPFMH